MNEREAALTGERLEGQSALEILSWAGRHFRGRATFGTGFGPEGCVLIDLIARHRLAIDVFTLDTGLFFAETYDLWRRLEARYGIAIRAVRPALSVEAQGEAYGERLWERDPDGCCALRKVAPLHGAIAGFEAWITAIRREQTPERAGARVVELDPRFGLVKVNPLALWSDADVWDHLRAHDVPVNPLHARGYASIGCQPCTTPVGAAEDPRAGRWRGRGKTECGIHNRTAPLKVVRDRPGRAVLLTHRPARPAVRRGGIVWFTGMSGAGKSTLAEALRDRIGRRQPLEILDGDDVRTHLSHGLGFSREDRDTNVRRIGYVARLLARHGVLVVTAAISPYAGAREEVRHLAEGDGVPFVEVFVEADLEALIARDVKGLYRRALAGEIPRFTGISDPYEPPQAPDVRVRSDRDTVEESLDRILGVLSRRGLVERPLLAAEG